MDVWSTIWTVIFAVTILVYTGLVAVVTVGGWSDIQAMFKQLDEAADDHEDDPKQGSL